MKRVRLIIGLVFLAAIIAIDVCACYYWKKMGCEAWSLFAEVAFYTVCLIGPWYVIDDAIKGKLNN